MKVWAAVDKYSGKIATNQGDLLASTTEGGLVNHLLGLRSGEKYVGELLRNKGWRIKLVDLEILNSLTSYRDYNKLLKNSDFEHYELDSLYGEGI